MYFKFTVWVPGAPAHGAVRVAVEPGLDGLLLEVVTLAVHHGVTHDLLGDGAHMPVWGLVHCHLTYGDSSVAGEGTTEQNRGDRTRSAAIHIQPSKVFGAGLRFVS